jgi:hypothetical protein
MQKPPRDGGELVLGRGLREGYPPASRWTGVRSEAIPVHPHTLGLIWASTAFVSMRSMRAVPSDGPGMRGVRAVARPSDHLESAVTKLRPAGYQPGTSGVPSCGSEIPVCNLHRR